MAIEVSCTCGKRLRARDELAGKKAKCPGCGAILAIPNPTSLEDAMYELAAEPAPAPAGTASVPMAPPEPSVTMPARPAAASASSHRYAIGLIAVPMVLHGLYDTLLKKDYEALALLSAVASFAWFAWQVESARTRFADQDEALVASA